MNDTRLWDHGRMEHMQRCFIVFRARHPLRGEGQPQPGILNQPHIVNHRMEINHILQFRFVLLNQIGIQSNFSRSKSWCSNEFECSISITRKLNVN